MNMDFVQCILLLKLAWLFAYSVDKFNKTRIHYYYVFALIYNYTVLDININNQTIFLLWIVRYYKISNTTGATRRAVFV